MFNKKLMILAIFIVSLLAVSAVSAAENATDDVVSADISNDVVSVEETSVDDLGVDNDNQVITEETNSDVGSFADLQTEINDIGEGGVLNLTKNYKYVNGSTDGISISKAITIDGQGHALDGNYLSKIFHINANNVKLMNIIFKRGNEDYLSYTAEDPIVWKGVNGYLRNCTFENSSCYLIGSNGIVSDCNFYEKGIKFHEDNCKLIYSNFYNGSKNGGIVNWYGDNGFLSNCNFENLTAPGYAPAVYWGGKNGKLLNSNFKNSNVMCPNKNEGGSAGAVWWFGQNGNLSNCNFENCYIGYSHTSVIKMPLYGGAIAWKGGNGKVSDCTFVNCTVSDDTEQCYGNAIYWAGDDGEIFGCIFEDCIRLNQNSHYVIYWYGENGVVTNNYFNPTFNSVYSQTYILIVNKLDAKIECNNVSFKYMGQNDFKLHLMDYFDNDLVNKKIIFENKDLNISAYSLTDNNGNVTLPSEFTKYAGNYTIYVSFEGDDNYNPIQSTFNLNIDPLDSSVMVNDCFGTVGYETTLSANVICSNNVNINQGTVIFFDGENNIGEINVKNGIASLTYTPNTAGKHTITAIYNSNNYVNSNNTFNFTVSKATVDLKANVATVYFSNPSNFVINVNSNSREVNEGKIKFYVNNVFINTSDVNNGVASLNYVMDAAGSFNLSVVYDGTDNYFGKNVSKIFYVDKMPTTLSGETTFFDDEQSRIFTVNLKGNKGDGVNNQTVKIEVVKYSGESKTLTNVTDENGVAFFDVGSLAGGMWIVRGIFDENNNYQGSLFTDKFIVIRMNTTTTIDEIKDSHKGYPIQLHANILDEFGVWITDGIAHFYVDGKDCGYIDYSSKRIFPYRSENKQILRASIPDFDNQLGATVADSSNLYLEYLPTEGTHTINVVYEGTSLYRPSNHTTTFEVQDGAVLTTLVATNINAIYNGGGYLVATLKDVWGKPIPNVKISINVKGVKYLTTDKNGQVKFSTNGLAPKSYTATITFAGNNNYVKSSATAKVTVKKSTPKLSATKKTFKKSVKIKKYAVTLKDNQNKVMKNTKVTIKVNKKTYTAKTNAKGKAVFKIKKLVKKGKYNAVVTYKGNKYYNKVTKKTKIIVK